MDKDNDDLGHAVYCCQLYVALADASFGRAGASYAPPNVRHMLETVKCDSFVDMSSLRTNMRSTLPWYRRLTWTYTFYPLTRREASVVWPPFAFGLREHPRNKGRSLYEVMMDAAKKTRRSDTCK